MTAIKDWALQRLNNQNILILDTETTGLYDAEIVDVAIINIAGDPVVNTLIKPKDPIPFEASRIHGITDKTVIDAPIFPDIYPFIKSAIEGQDVLIYNSAFDTEILKYNCDLHGLPRIEYNPECIMLPYSEYVGEWSDYWGNWKWQRLPGGNHRALGDCQAALKVLQRMAGIQQEKNPDLSLSVDDIF